MQEIVEQVAEQAPELDAATVVSEPETDIQSTAEGEIEPDELPDAPKVPVGRPQTGTVRVSPFPKPPKANLKGGYITGDKFHQYWKGLPKPCRDRGLVYVYREYPKMNYMLALSPKEQEEVAKRKRRPPTKNIAKFSEPFESTDWRGEMLRRFGEGDYKLILNDSAMKASTPFAQNICKAWIELRDEEYPPVIEDLRCVDPDDPMNGSYLKKMELAGLLNRTPQAQENTPEEKEDMALAEVVKDLSDKLIQNSERPQQAPSPQQATPSSEAAQIVGTAAKEGINIVVNALKSAQEHQTKSQDPKAYMQDVMETAKAFHQPQNNGTDAIVGLLTEQLKLAESRRQSDMELAEKRHQREVDLIRDHNAAQLAQIEERIKLITVTNATAAGPIVNQPAQGLDKAIDTLVSLADKFDELRGEKGDGLPAWAPLALQGLKIVGDVATNFMHNAAVVKTGQGAPLPPPQTSAEIEEGQDSEAAQLAGFARQIHQPMKEALQSKMPGHEFAARLIVQLGNTTFYDTVCADGQAGLVHFLQSAPEVWGTFQSFGAGNQNAAFMEQFLNRDAVMQTVEILKTPPAQRRTQQRNGPLVNVEPIS